MEVVAAHRTRNTRSSAPDNWTRFGFPYSFRHHSPTLPPRIVAAPIGLINQARNLEQAKPETGIGLELDGPTSEYRTHTRAVAIAIRK